MLDFKNFINYLFSFSSNDRGKVFELYCKWFLENDPKYSSQLKKVWLWKDWPENWGRDKGIDLIAETYNGKIWAIQAKAYDSNYHITKEDIDKFLSETSRKQIAFRLLISTTNNIGYNAIEVINAQEKPIALHLLDNLEKSSLEWPDDISKIDVKEIKEKRFPRDHQEIAIKYILDGFEKSSIGQVHMACGTGKTLVGLWVTEKLKSNLTLVLVPSISLVSQIYKEWVNNKNDSFNFYPIFVCSDETVYEKDNENERIIEKTIDLGFPVTTNVNELLNEISSIQNSKVIFATYHSSPIIEEACKIDQNLIFDMAIADEAHRCAGKAKNYFATIVNKKAIRTNRKLFMTATPRIYTNNVKKIANDVECEVVSMDDEEKFGPIFYKLAFSEAIKQNLLADYQVIISVMNNKTYQEYAERGRFISINNHETDARTLASQLLVAKVIKQYDLKKIITFHNRKNNAKEFINTFDKALEIINPDEKPSIEYTDVIFGEMVQSERYKILKRLKENKNCSIIANVKCLSEGIDVPALDGIVFIDPKGSEIDIVQAVGRAIRNPNKDIKKIGTIIIPIFIDYEDDHEISLDQSCFKTVWKVIKALRAHDDILAEELDNIRLELGKRTYKSPPKLTKVIIDISTQVEFKFVNSIKLKLIRHFANTCSYWVNFEEACNFVRRLRLKNDAEWRAYVAGEMGHLPALPFNIPKAPWAAYKDTGWINLGDFLGTDVIAPRLKKYLDYEGAAEFAKKSGFKRKRGLVFIRERTLFRKRN